MATLLKMAISETLRTPRRRGWSQRRIADELGVRPHQVGAAVELLDGGSTVPFIARYRKERTDSLDEEQLRQLEERLGYRRHLEGEPIPAATRAVFERIEGLD